jgi:hypothetical protein
MKLIQPAICIILLLNIFSCKESNLVHFEDKESGWEFDYPKEWKIVPGSEVLKLEGKGKENLETSTGTDIAITHKNLIYIRKNETTTFTGVMQAYDSVANGSYEAAIEEIFALLSESYKSKEDVLDYSARRKEIKIDDLDFYVFEFTLIDKITREILLNQYFYQRHFDNRFSLSITASFTDEDGKTDIMSMINSSKFRIRN